MIALTDSPGPDFKTLLEEGLSEYNETQVRRQDWRVLAVTARDAATGEVAGGILGRTSLGLFFLDLFYLPAHMRRSGIGGSLLRMAESEAMRRGCLAATLVTVNFQAPDFYARHGWDKFGRIQSAPDIERIFMRKSLTP